MFARLVASLRQNQPLGSGVEKHVYAFPDSGQPPRTVIGVYHEDEFRNTISSKQLKYIFYTGKLLSLLFPYQFPDVQMVTTQPATIQKQFIDGRNSDWDNDDERHEAKQFVAEVEGATGLWLDDMNPENFIIESKGGNIVYIDDVMYLAERELDANKLRSAIDDRLSRDPAKHAQALKYLRRLLLSQGLDSEIAG